MRISRRTWVLLAALLVVAGSIVGAQERATVGDLLVKIAEARKIDARTPADASASLRAHGFAVPSRGFDDPLTEGFMVQIAGAFGIRVTTVSPEATFDLQQVDSFMAAFSTELSSDVERTIGDEVDADGLGNNGNGADPLEKGKGKKKGIRTPDDPA
jgi:hypothetical protein